jgi:DNA (cytosine-5)-methyltransferase 1
VHISQQGCGVRYLSVCSGIEAATVAWHPLGWTPVAFSEIEAFPSAVLAHHYPTVPNWGDMTRYAEWPDADIDVLVGGTPCQSFSVAGLRQGLADPRGNLMLTLGAIAGKYRPEWLVWENVPGVLSSDGGRDFGALLGMLAELGYGFAYRVLDAQYVRVDGHARAVPQRRRRVFVVGHLGSWRRAAAVLFERESLSGHPAPRREAGQATPTIPGRSRSVAFAVPVAVFDPNQITSKANRSQPTPGLCHTLPGTAKAPVAFQPRFARNDRGAPSEVAYPPTAEAGRTGKGDSAQCVASSMAVRRLTPVECERLQAFPDGYTDIPYRGKPAADGPRYRALGNSMACNVMRWIGMRIAMVAEIAAAEATPNDGAAA